jgi:hypothetical protein
MCGLMLQIIETRVMANYTFAFVSIGRNPGPACDAHNTSNVVLAIRRPWIVPVAH